MLDIRKEQQNVKKVKKNLKKPKKLINVHVHCA